MRLPIPDRVIVRTLVGLEIFGVLSALVGAILALAVNGAGVPLAYLAGSPFESFAAPGLLLGLVIGGTQCAAAVALMSHRRGALLLSAIAGFGMLIWIFAELAIIRHYSWLQTAYFVHGGLELLLVLALLGIAPTIAAPYSGSDRRDQHFGWRS